MAFRDPMSTERRGLARTDPPGNSKNANQAGASGATSQPKPPTQERPGLYPVWDRNGNKILVTIPGREDD